MMEQGKQIFRYDTFGDEAYWSGQLKLHQAIQGSRFSNVGPRHMSAILPESSPGKGREHRPADRRRPAR